MLWPEGFWTLVIGFLLALAIALVTVPYIRKAALAANMFDAPGERKIHSQPIPRLGGVAIFIAFVGALGLLGFLGLNPLPGQGIIGLLAGGTLLFLLGLLDDFLNLSPYVKLAGQLFGASVAYGLGVSIVALDLPGSKLLLLNAISFPITLLWLGGISNAMNFIDGVDGLAGGVSSIAALTLMLVALFTGQPEAALLAALLAGSCIGFLVYNLNPAKIFMGDSGALFIGFSLASIAVLGALKTYTVMMLTPILVLCVPVADITYSVLRRLVRGQNPMLADADHLHHRLLKAGLSQKRVVFLFYGICWVFGFFVAGYVKSVPLYLVIMVSVAALTGLLRFLIFRSSEKAPPARSNEASSA